MRLTSTFELRGPRRPVPTPILPPANWRRATAVKARRLPTVASSHSRSIRSRSSPPKRGRPAWPATRSLELGGAAPTEGPWILVLVLPALFLSLLLACTCLPTADTADLHNGRTAAATYHGSQSYTTPWTPTPTPTPIPTLAQAQVHTHNTTTHGSDSFPHPSRSCICKIIPEPQSRRSGPLVPAHTHSTTLSCCHLLDLGTPAADKLQRSACRAHSMCLFAIAHVAKPVATLPSTIHCSTLLCCMCLRPSASPVCVCVRNVAYKRNLRSCTPIYSRPCTKVHSTAVIEISLGEREGWRWLGGKERPLLFPSRPLSHILRVWSPHCSIR